MTTIRVNNVRGTTLANPITLTLAGTVANWVSAPALPTIKSPNYAWLTVEADTANEEVIKLTDYTAGATSGTVVRAQQGTAAMAHTGTAWHLGPTKSDFDELNITDNLGHIAPTAVIPNPSPPTDSLIGMARAQVSFFQAWLNWSKLPQPAPAAAAAAGGTLAAGTYGYVVTAINANGGETPIFWFLNAPATVTINGTTNKSVTLTWAAVTASNGVAATGYKIYGRTSTGADLIGSMAGTKLIATVGAVLTYTDDGTVAPGATSPADIDTSGAKGCIMELGCPSGTNQSTLGDLPKWLAATEQFLADCDAASLPVSWWDVNDWGNTTLSAYTRTSTIDPRDVISGDPNCVTPAGYLYERHPAQPKRPFTPAYWRAINYPLGSRGHPYQAATSATFSNSRDNMTFGFPAQTFQPPEGPQIASNWYNYGSAAMYRFLASRGLKTVCITFTYERLLKTTDLTGATATIDATEGARLDAAIANAKAAGLNVILRAMGSGLYFLDDTTQGVAKALGSASYTNTAYARFWDRISNRYKAETAVIGYTFDNEPGEAIGPTLAQWQSATQAAVTAIRSQGSTQTCYVPCYAENLPPFNWSIPNGPWINDSTGNIVYDMHFYFDHAGSYSASYKSLQATLATTPWAAELDTLTVPMIWLRANPNLPGTAVPADPTLVLFAGDGSRAVTQSVVAADRAIHFKQAGTDFMTASPIAGAGSGPAITAAPGVASQAQIGYFFGVAALVLGSVQDTVLYRQAAAELVSNRLLLQASADTQVPLVAQRKNSTHNVDLIQAQQENATIGGGTVLFYVDKNGSVGVKKLGQGLKVAEGANAKQGLTAAMVAGTVTVANTSVTASSRIMLTRQEGGTNPGCPNVSARVVGTSFTITSTNAADTGQVAYEIYEPA